MEYQVVVPTYTALIGAPYGDVLRILQSHINRKGHISIQHENARLHVANVSEYSISCNVNFVADSTRSVDTSAILDLNQ